MTKSKIILLVIIITVVFSAVVFITIYFQKQKELPAPQISPGFPESDQATGSPGLGQSSGSQNQPPSEEQQPPKPEKETATPKFDVKKYSNPESSFIVEIVNLIYEKLKIK